MIRSRALPPRDGGWRHAQRGRRGEKPVIAARKRSRTGEGTRRAKSRGRPQRPPRDNACSRYEGQSPTLREHDSTEDRSQHDQHEREEQRPVQISEETHGNPLGAVAAREVVHEPGTTIMRSVDQLEANKRQRREEHNAHDESDSNQTDGKSGDSTHVTRVAHEARLKET